jgi:hypothetical protein
MMEAVRTSETSVDNHFTRQYIPGENSEHHTRRRENLKSHLLNMAFAYSIPLQPTTSLVTYLNSIMPSVNNQGQIAPTSFDSTSDLASFDIWSL